MKSMQNAKILLPFMLLFSLSFTACSPKEAELKPCTISYSWWGKEERCKYTLQGIEKFEEKNPNIKVEPEYCSWEEYEESFGSKLQSGQCADVMQINFDWLYKYSPDGNAFYDLNELKDYIDLYNFTLDDLSYGTLYGKLNAIPIAFNTAIPVFDLKILQENGLKIPSNWDELFAMAKVLKEKEMYVFTISKRHLFFLAMSWFEQTYSKKMFSNNGSLNISEEEVCLIYDFVKRLVEENVVYSFNDGFQLNAIREKKVAGAVLWCNETSIFISEVTALGGIPVLGNFIARPDALESGWYLKPACLFAIKKDCKNPEAAAMLINYLLNDQEFALLQKNEKGVPISNKSLTALMEAKQLESMQYTALMKIRFNNDSINKMLPFMEDNNVILPFADNAYFYLMDQQSREEAASSFIDSVR
ncbi:MAG: ABC transporter substrate-binding protein [Treponema sp.]|nr:ABC transporter substrate-binding protein [Treponema sp.]